LASDIETVDQINDHVLLLILDTST